MCDQPQIDEINDVSETESEGWDIVRAEELQSAENTSDAESIEVINEEENVQISTTEQNLSENCEIKNEEEDAALSSTFTAEIIHTSEVTDSPATNWFHGYIPTSVNINSLLAEQKNALFIYFAVVCVIIAMFMAPRDEQAESTTKTDIYECQGLPANLIKELQMYRESNAKLEKQVKELYEVINGLNKFRFIAPINQKHNAQEENNATLETEADSAHHSNKFIDELNEIIHFYKGLTYLPNNTYNFKNSPIIDDIFVSLYNESVESTLKLFINIPTHLNQLSKVISKKNTAPFINKWGKKLDKFSTSIEEDFNRMKLKTIKHVLRGINDLTFLFYRRLCNSELHKFISFEECDSLYLSRPWKRRPHHSNGNIYKTRKHNPNEESLNDVFLEREVYENKQKEKINKIDESNEINVENEDQLFLIRRNLINKLKKKRDTKQKILNMNYSENLPEKNNINSKFCGNQNFVKCNHTSRKERLNVIDGNWFLNIGDQRSHIRREKNKFEYPRYHKRKFKNYERYYKPPPPSPSFFPKKIFHKFSHNFGPLFRTLFFM